MKSLLFHNYKKRTRLIMAGIRKMKSRPGMEDIHKLRVQIKKVRAYFRFFEIVAPNDFRAKRINNFKSIYKYSGSIRERQLNLRYLNQYNLPPLALISFKQNVEKEITELKKTLKSLCKKFKDDRLSETRKKIKQLVKRTNKKTIINKSNKFIVEEAEKITKLQTDFGNSDTIHTIRKHLKALGAIASLLVDITQNKKLEKSVKQIKKTELVLGNWHDKIVLINALEKFTKKNKNNVKNGFLHFKKLIEKLKRENELLLKILKPQINTVTRQIKENRI